MIILDTLLIGGLRFVLGKIAAAVEAEISDDTALREELLAAQMRAELGEISEAEYGEIEGDLLRRISEVRARNAGGEARPGAFRVTGIEATIVEDERGADEAVETPPKRRRR